MASVIVFPNVATHRRLPHLQPKDNHGKDKDAKDKAHSAAATPADGSDTISSQDALHSGMRQLSLQEGPSKLQLTQGQPRPMLPAPEDTAAPATHTRLIEPALAIDTHKDAHAQIQASASSIQQRLPMSSASDSPYSSLPPSGPPSAASNKQPHHHTELLKTAIYDAFGCLYHPVQHTHPTSSTLKNSLTAALRSGEVTPLVGISPRASPRLLPQQGAASGPITPLELSSDTENAAPGHAGGYFGITPGQRATGTVGASSSDTGTSSSQGASKQGTAETALSGGQHDGHHTHQHNGNGYRDSNQPHRPHTSSHLQTASSWSDEGDDQSHSSHLSSDLNNSGRQSRPRSVVSSRRSSVFMMDAPLMSAAEHPVLNTLQSMSHHHVLPSYLDHDLGHDCIPLSPQQQQQQQQQPTNAVAVVVTPAPISVSSVLSATPPTGGTNTSNTNSNTSASAAPTPASASPALPTATTVAKGDRRPSLAHENPLPVFAMDREGPIPQGLGNQKLV